jgi:phosphoribosylformylglycinamidine cyclo-ligase
MSDQYKQSGVNVALGDKFSEFCARILSECSTNSPFVEVRPMSGGFRGGRPFRFQKVPSGFWLDVGPDGAGSKTIFHAHSKEIENAYQDVLAMTCGDTIRHGGLPVVFSNVFDVSSLGEDENSDAYKLACRMIEGFAKICKSQNIVPHKGETAELGVCVGSENPNAKIKFNLAGFAIGIFHEKYNITGETLKPGQVVVALKENGFRSNGISLVRKAIVDRFGKDWYNHLGDPQVQNFVDEASVPSVLYDLFLAKMIGWYDEVDPPKWRPEKIHAISHITGGGVESKFFNDILKPHGLSAMLTDLFELPRIMKDCADIRHLSSKELYSTWNGGQGVLVVLNKEDGYNFIKAAAQFNIDAKIAGEIIQTAHSSLVIDSKYDQEIVTYY